MSDQKEYGPDDNPVLYQEKLIEDLATSEAYLQWCVDILNPNYDKLHPLSQMMMNNINEHLKRKK